MVLQSGSAAYARPGPPPQVFWPLAAAGLCIVLMLVGAAAAWGQDSEYRWSVSPYVGLQQPSLTQVNESFVAPYAGVGTLVDVLGNGITQRFTYPTPLAPLNPGTLAGLEFRYQISDRQSFLFGAADWEASASTSTLGTMPIQGSVAGISSVRNGDIRYTEFYLGWRYDILHKPKKYSLYVTAQLHDVYDVNYQDTFTMVYTSGPAVTFRKTTVTTAHGTGLPVIQPTLGGEWFVLDWLSFGLEGGYDFGLRQINLNHAVQNTDILDTDDLTLNPPVTVGTNGVLNCQCRPGGPPLPLKVDFNGWKMLLKASLYF